MVPYWKVKREFLRLFTQVRELGLLAQGHINRRAYDQTERANVIETSGDMPATQNMVVLLIYQPDALLDSLFFELDHLRQKGLSVVLVANHPLIDNSIERLKPYCHLILQRPNIGYDFGGYREGVLLLLDRGYSLDTLFVMNDSVWFPLRQDCTLIDTALADPAHTFGIFQNTKNRKAVHHHLQSYFYRFRSPLIQDPKFRVRWKRMPFFTSKRLVIRRLEIRLSGYFASLGYSTASLVTPADVAKAGAALNDDELKQVAFYHSTTTPRGRDIFQTLDDLSPTDDSWPAERARAISDSRFRYYYIDAHPLVMFKHMNTPFLKKSREFHYAAQRDELVRSGFQDRFASVVRDEITGWNARIEVEPPAGDGFPSLKKRLEIWDARSSGKSS